MAEVLVVTAEVVLVVTADVVLVVVVLAMVMMAEVSMLVVLAPGVVVGGRNGEEMLERRRGLGGDINEGIYVIAMGILVM